MAAKDFVNQAPMFYYSMGHPILAPGDSRLFYKKT